MTYTRRHPGEPERPLAEAERLTATDILESMNRRTRAMLDLILDPGADLRVLEERLLESGKLADALWTVLYAAWNAKET